MKKLVLWTLQNFVDGPQSCQEQSSVKPVHQPVDKRDLTSWVDFLGHVYIILSTAWCSLFLIMPGACANPAWGSLLVEMGKGPKKYDVSCITLFSNVPIGWVFGRRVQRQSEVPQLLRNQRLFSIGENTARQWKWFEKAKPRSNFPHFW